MRLLIAGSRSINNYELLETIIKKLNLSPKIIISGGADGIDTLAEVYANKNNILLEKYEAEWNKYGKSAGVIRNGIMSKKCSHALILWDGKSSGTKNMIDLLIREKNVNDIFIYIKKKNGVI